VRGIGIYVRAGAGVNTQALGFGQVEESGRVFDDQTLERFRRVMPVVNMLNKKYGRDTVRLAGVKQKGRWRTKAAKRGSRYTTKLAEVLILKCQD
jgi:hypothetical protein